MTCNTFKFCQYTLRVLQQYGSNARYPVVELLQEERFVDAGYAGEQMRPVNASATLDAGCDRIGDGGQFRAGKLGRKKATRSSR